MAVGIDDIYDFVIKHTRYVWLPFYAMFTLFKELLDNDNE